VTLEGSWKSNTAPAIPDAAVNAATNSPAPKATREARGSGRRLLRVKRTSGR
jgi:hypothetical protein